MTSDSLLNMTQGLMTPDFLQKFSGVIGQPVERIQAGLRSVIPTFLLGVVNKGETAEGAQSLVSLAQKQEIDPAFAPEQLTNEHYLKSGNEALNGIFGGSLSSIVNKLGTATGMNASSIVKMMGLVAPVIIGVLGTKIRSENLSANGLKAFLLQQKSSLLGFIPAGVSGMFTPGEMTGQHRHWGMIAFAIMVLIFFFLWWHDDDREKDSSIEGANVTAPSAEVTLPVVNELNAFFNSGAVSELPKRFRFQHLMFETGSSLLAGGSDAELDQIATVLKSHPSSSVRLEAFSENIQGSSNQALAERRAAALKDELVSRGVKDSQIEAVGMGSTQSTSNRIEFVVTKL